MSISIELDTYTFSEEGPPSPMPVCVLLSETTERAVVVQATTVDGTALGKTNMKPGLVTWYTDLLIYRYFCVCLHIPVYIMY